MTFIHGQIKDPVLRHILRAEGGVSLCEAPPAADDNWFKTTVNPSGTSGGETITTTSFTNANPPGLPVVVKSIFVEATGSDVTAVVSTVVGEDQFGDVVTDVITHTDSSGTWTGEGVVAYQKLTSVVCVITGTTVSADTHIIGFGKKYGLTRKIDKASDVVASTFNGAADAGTINIANSTYNIAGTPDAAKFLRMYIRGGYYTHV